MPNYISGNCQDLIAKLLIRNPLERIGAIFGVNELLKHSWFAEIDWEEIRN
jgi:hypothetical protein